MSKNKIKKSINYEEYIKTEFYNFFEGIERENPVVLVNYLNNKITELEEIVRYVSGNYEIWSELAMVYYYMTNFKAFTKTYIKAIRECEKGSWTWFHLGLRLKAFYKQLNLLINEFLKNFNIS